MIELYNDDCVNHMLSMPDDIIDLTVTSPPYDDIRDYDDSLHWNEKIWQDIIQELYRVTKDGGVCVWIVNDRIKNGSKSGNSFKQSLYALETGFKLHDVMIYNRSSMPNQAKRYNQDFEFMFVWAKGKIRTFNPIKVPCTYAGVGTSPTVRNKKGVLEGKGRRIIKDTKKKSNIWQYSAGHSKSTHDKEAHEHPAIFPERLVEDHIKTWSNEGDLVFDPMMGSGTTGKMCKMTGRHFIGVEKVSNYYDIALKRINKFKINT